MKSTHNTFRAVVLAIGLTLLVVSGTAAMMTMFSDPVPTPDPLQPVSSLSTTSTSRQQPGTDTVLYERVARADGSHQWVLTEQVGGTLPHSGDTSTLASANSAGNVGAVTNVSYTLLAQPKLPGLSKLMKDCSKSSAYDFSCPTI